MSSFKDEGLWVRVEMPVTFIVNWRRSASSKVRLHGDTLCAQALLNSHIFSLRSTEAGMFYSSTLVSSSDEVVERFLDLQMPAA